MVTDRVFHYFHDIINRTMEIRAKKNILRPDFIHLFMEARKGRLHLDEIRGSSATNDSESVRGQKELAMNLTDEDITAQAMLFIFGGYDTSSKLLSFCLYELAVNPMIQEKLREEIEANFQKFNGKIDYEDLFTMKYLDMVLSGIYPINLAFFTIPKSIIYIFDVSQLFYACRDPPEVATGSVS